MIQNSYRLITLLLFYHLTFLSFAGQSIFDFDGKKQESSKVEVYKKALKRLSYFDSIQHVDSLKYYIEEAKILCSKIDTSSLKNSAIIESAAEIYNFMGYYFFKNDQLSDAIVVFTHAEGLYRILKNDEKVALSLNNKAVMYLNSGNKIEALKNFHKTIAIYIGLNDSLGLATVYNNISKIYKQQGDFQRALTHIENSLSIARELDNPVLLSRVINAMAGIKRKVGDLDNALSLYQEALSLTYSANDELMSAEVLNNMGVIHLELKEYSKAKDLFERAYEIVKRKNFRLGEAFSLNSLAKYYFITDNPNKAIGLSEESLEIGKEIGNNEVITKATERLLEIYASLKNWEKAFFYQGLLIDQKIKHEQNTIEQVSQQESIRLKLENERFIIRERVSERALENEIENQRKNIFYISFSVVLLLLVTALFVIYYRLQSSREKNRYITKESEERKLLLQEVHHRVKNNFQIVSSMLRLQSYNFDNEELRLNFEEAVNRINAMAIVHDVIYRQEKFRDINSKTYLEKLIQTLHKTGESRILINVESEEIPFKIETLINLGIAINELITNSFKHAFKLGDEQPKIHISLHTIAEKTYELNYKDNGVGLSKDSYSSNFGMDLIETIIDNYEGTVQIVEDKDWSTAIKITFKEF